MPTMTSHKPGTFSWVELATTDPAAAKKFYSGLFGWTYDDNPMGPDMVYSTCKMGADAVGALYKMGAERAGVPSHWTNYIEVESADAIAKAVEANGGKVMQAPFDVMTFGRMAVFTDPTGAVFAVWQSNQHKGMTLKGEVGSLTWNELLTGDTAAARAFYTKVVGWDAQDMPMGAHGTYTLWHRHGDDPNVSQGGMMALPPDMKSVPPHWMAYFRVADIEAATKKASELGATVLVGNQEVPNMGRFSIVQDPTGAAFALWYTTM